MSDANSSLLINESPMQVQPMLIKLLGVSEAMMLQQVQYWLSVVKRSGKKKIDGRYWVYKTYEQWHEEFYFWDISTIKRTIKRLEMRGVLLSANYNKTSFDRTKWYSIDYNTLNELLRDAEVVKDIKENPK